VADELGRVKQDYVKKIYELIQKRGNVREVDLAKEMNLSKPSVCIAIKDLQEKGYVQELIWPGLQLTRKGEELGKELYARYVFYQGLLMQCGISEEDAKKEACMMEHVQSSENFLKLQEYFCSSMKSQK